MILDSILEKLPHIWHTPALNVFFTHKNHIIEKALYNANLVIDFCYGEKT